MWERGVGESGGSAIRQGHDYSQENDQEIVP